MFSSISTATDSLPPTTVLAAGAVASAIAYAVRRYSFAASRDAAALPLQAASDATLIPQANASLAVPSNSQLENRHRHSQPCHVTSAEAPMANAAQSEPKLIQDETDGTFVTRTQEHHASTTTENAGGQCLQKNEDYEASISGDDAQSDYSEETRSNSSVYADTEVSSTSWGPCSDQVNAASGTPAESGRLAPIPGGERTVSWAVTSSISASSGWRVGEAAHIERSSAELPALGNLPPGVECEDAKDRSDTGTSNPDRVIIASKWKPVILRSPDGKCFFAGTSKLTVCKNGENTVWASRPLWTLQTRSDDASDIHVENLQRQLESGCPGPLGDKQEMYRMYYLAKLKEGPYDDAVNTWNLSLPNWMNFQVGGWAEANGWTVDNVAEVSEQFDVAEDEWFARRWNYDEKVEPELGMATPIGLSVVRATPAVTQPNSVLAEAQVASAKIKSLPQALVPEEMPDELADLSPL